MAITVPVSQEMERQLRADFPDLERRFVEGYAVEAFRRGEISSHQVGQILGLGGRASAIRFLSERGVYPGYDADDFAQDLQTLESLSAPAGQRGTSR